MTKEEEPWLSEEDIQRLKETVEASAIAFRAFAEGLVNAVGPIFTQLAEQFRESLTLVPRPEEGCPFDCSSCLFFCFPTESLGLTEEELAREEGFDE